MDSLEIHYGLAPFDAATMAPAIVAALGEIPCDLLGPLPGALGPASLDALAERIAAGTYTLLHLVAHGWVRTDGETILYLLDAQGRVAPVTAPGTVAPPPRPLAARRRIPRPGRHPPGDRRA